MVILKRNLAARGIVISDMRDDPNEHVTVDLSVGDRYQVAGKPEWYELRRSYALRPGNCILVKTEERVTLPDDVFGILCSKGSLSASGLIVSNTKVDPLFGDQLNIPIFNSGRTTIRISAGMPFCSICFHTLEQKVARDVHRRAIGQHVPRRRVTDVFAAHSSAIISGAIGGIATILAAIVGYVFFRTVPAQNPAMEKRLEHPTPAVNPSISPFQGRKSPIPAITPPRSAAPKEATQNPSPAS